MQRLSVISVLFALLAVGVRSVMAGGSGEIPSFPITGAFQATHREDRGPIAIIDFVGNYNRQLDSGQNNVEARAVVAQEFFRTHPDSYDFLVIFSTFEFETGDALAFHWGVQNQVQGIGLNPFDVSHLFGSGGRLLGYIDMAALSRYVTDPIAPAFEDTLSVLGHEMMHQWSGRARVLNEQGELSTVLLGKDGSHWSDLLETNASVLYGHKWRDNGDGTFTSEATRSFFSPLDLYLAGWYGADEVPPFFLIDNPDHPAAVVPTPDITVEGTARVLTIDEVIAAEGPRIPDASKAQKTFRFAFILLTTPGTEILVSQTSAIEQISTKFAERFAVWTGGRALVHTTPEARPALSPGAPEAIAGNGVRVIPEALDTALFEAADWLRRQQSSEGSWQDKPTTQLRDTAMALEALLSIDPHFSGRDSAIAWLQAQNPQSTDYLARQAHSLLNAGASAAVPYDAMLARQHESGGWGIGPNFASDPLDTALVLAALAQRPPANASIIDKAIQYLALSQRPDGSWNARDSGPGRVNVTTRALSALHRFHQQETAQDTGLNWLAGQQQADGGFGEAVSTIHDTAHVLRTLILLEATDRVRIDDVGAYLLAQQHADGSWDGSRYTTALTILALNSFRFPNWRFDATWNAEPERPVDGERVRLALTVRNEGHSKAPETVVRLYNGAPENGGQPIGGDLRVPILASGDAVTLQPFWDSFGAAGTQTLVAMIDPDQEQAEGSESDNRIERNITVEAAPAGVDLLVETFTIAPSNPDTLPSTLAMTAIVRNVGATPATNVRIQLRKGDADNGEVVAERLDNVPERSSIAATFTTVLNQPGAATFTVVVDADNAIEEASEGNNTSTAMVETRASVDLQLAAGDLRLTPQPVLIGSDVEFQVTLRNAGSSLSPNTVVTYVITDGENTTVLDTQTMQLAGGSSVNRTIQWRPDRAGDLVFTAQLDPDQLVPELDEQNNDASLAFRVGEVNGPNLAVSFHDVTLTPNPGREGVPTTVTALIRNTGDAEARDVTVAFYDGDPAQGGTTIHTPQTLASLAGGASASASVVWPTFPDASDKLVFVSIDPDNTIAEFSESDNTAFKRLAVLSRPDLALQSADVRLTPSFPVQGQPVRIDARITNLGEQDVTDAVVRLFQGDPDAGGIQVSDDQLVTISGGAGEVASFTWLPTGLNTVKTLVVSVDPDHAIVEASELNNTATKELIVQDGDFYVSHRYFSPNGDGVQDATTFAFRVGTPSPNHLDVVVRDETEVVVRHLNDLAIVQGQDGLATWDGLDDLGRVVPDGDYYFRVSDRDGKSIGEALVVVDNNRSSLVDSIGTIFANFNNLTCQLGDVRQVIMTDDESTVFARVGESEAFVDGLYRMTGSGLRVTPLVRSQDSLYIEQMQVAPDGSSVAYIEGDSLDFSMGRLFLINGDGTNRRELALSADDRPTQIHAVIPERHTIVVETESLTSPRLSKLVMLSFFGGAPHTVHAASRSFEGLSFEGVSPRRDAFLFRTDSTVYRANLNTGETFELFKKNTMNTTVQTAQWSPDGNQVAIKLLERDQHRNWSYRVQIVSAAGETLHDVVMPLSVPSSSSGCPALSSRHMTWSPDGRKLVLDVLRQAVDECGIGDVFEGGIYTLDAETGDVSLTYELERPYAWDSFVVRDLVWSQDGSALFSRLLGRDIVALRRSDQRILPLLDAQGEVVHTNAAIWLSPTGRQLFFQDDADATDPESPCYQSGITDTITYRSLLNLTTELRATRLSQGHGVILSGIASDLNFSYYLLEYANVTTPDDWHPILPASGQPVLQGDFTTWVPPSPGAYWVRLTATDLAGNQRSEIARVSWSDTASITDFYRTPELFSPNGDGVLDDMVVHYRVLEPVHLTFAFYNEAGERVRTLTRDHPEVGVAHTFIWDGRDDRGRVLPDGVYRVEVLNVQLSVTLDATPPEIEFILKEPYQAQGLPGLDVNRVLVQPSLSWSVLETHYLQGNIEMASVDRPNAWHFFRSLGPLQRSDGSTSFIPMQLRQTNRQLFRLVVEDRAGNRTVAETRIVPQLMIHGFGDHQAQEGAEQCRLDPSRLQTCLDDLGGYYAPQDLAYHAPIASRDGPTALQVVTEPVVRFAVAESIETPLARVTVQYRPLSEPDWQEIALSDFLDHAPLPNLYDTPLNEAMDIIWELPTLRHNVTHVARLKAFDEAGQVYISNAIRFMVEDTLVFKGLTQNATAEESQHYRLPFFASPGKRPLWGLNISPEPLREVQLFLSSPDDPRYQIEKEVGRIKQPDEVLVFEAELAACRNYTGQLIGLTPSSGVVKSSVISFRMPCLNLAVKIEPPSSLDCNQPSAQQLNLQFAPSSLDGTGLKLLTLARVDAAGHEDVVYNVNRPHSVSLTNTPGNASNIYVYDISRLVPPIEQPPFTYAFAYDVSSLSDGPAQLVARLTNVNDEAISLSIEALIDRTPPSLALTYPPEGALTCGVPTLGRDGEIHNIVTIQGQISDDHGVHYTLSADGVDIYDSRLMSLSPNGQLIFNKPSLPPFHLHQLNGPLAQLADENGEVTLQLDAYDWGGFRQCIQRSFVVDSQVDAAAPSVSPSVFSPNGNGVADTISIHHQSRENMTLDVHIYAARTGPYGDLEISGSILRRLETNKLLLSGTALSTWDGLDDSHTTLPDGWYGIVSTYTDTCGNQQQYEAFIELDITPPAATISYPASDSPLTMRVEVQGSVQDPHLQTYYVQVGAGATPETWSTLQRGEDPVLDGVLAQWNTFGVSGRQVLRLLAEDTVGNISVVEVPLTVADRTYLISALSASPTLFSPNGDGTWEQTSLTIGVQEEVLLTLTLLDTDEQPRRTLVVEQTAAPGVTLLNWDGFDDAGQRLPDGSYTVALKAVLAANPAVTQEETATVTIDTTPPEVEITRPTDGVVTSAGQVQGQITDANLNGYTVSMTNTPEGPQTIELSTGIQNVDGGPLGPLAGLQEGPHILTIEATDEAANKTVVHLPFVVDNSPPVATLTAPQTNTILGAPQDPVDILGVIRDDHFAHYTLRFGAGETPSVWTHLSESDTLPTSTQFAQWAVGALADGIYTLHLFAEDKAGLTSEAQRLITVDNTPPSVNLTHPMNDTYVTATIAITGVASDDHLTSYNLDLAPESAPEQRSPIGSGSQSVTNGSLFVWQSLPPDGTYLLRLTATDQAGHESITQHQVMIDTTPPDAAHGLAATVTEQSVQLGWQASTANDVVGYFIFRDGQRLTSDPIATTAYRDTTASEGRYTYTITAVDQAGLESQPSEALSIAVDITPPTARLTTPAADATVSGVVEIAGTAHSQDDFKQYRISIGEGAAPISWQLLRQSPAPVQSERLAQWSTLGLSEGTIYTIRLEAEDINGNISSATTTVRVDNEAPVPPTGLAASVIGSDVHLTWSANNEADLHGYLVFRDGQLALPGAASRKDLRQNAIQTLSHIDINVADGPSSYTLVAIDQAGNIGQPSAPVSVNLNARAPHAEWVTPVDGEAFDGALYVLATVADRDVAHVRIEYKAAADASWLAMSPADSTAPFDATFDPVALGLPFGLYDLRAVATDTAAQVDPNPPVITVNYTDLTRPDSVRDVVAQVTGADTQLTWRANTEPDLKGYHIERRRGDETPVRLTSAPIRSVHYADTGLADASYSYTVIALDTFDNASSASEDVAATVYTPMLQTPETPTRATTVTLSGQGITAATVSGEIATSTGSTPLASAQTDASGQFTLTDLPLERGENQFTLRLTDAKGNVSKDAVVTIVSAEPPSAPTGLAAVVSDLTIDLTWNPNPESDIAGYLLRRHGALVLPTQVISDASLSAASNISLASHVIDDNPFSYWQPAGDEQGQWLALAWAEPRLISQVELRWNQLSNTPTGFDLEAWNGHQWVRLTTRQPSEQLTAIDLPEPYLTTQLRLVLHTQDRPRLTRLSTFRVFNMPLISDTAYADRVSDGRHTYTLTAVNIYGFESPPSGVVEAEAGDVTAPPPVTLTATVADSDVELTWTASTASDVQHYALYRDATLLVQTTDLQYSDTGLLNGTYHYTVRVVDQIGNVSQNSNAIDAVVAIARPTPPSNLQVVGVPSGGELELNWQPESNSALPRFNILRSEEAGGPYDVVGQASESTYTDTGLNNGVTYFYVVVAVDAIGNLSDLSNEAHGTPEDQIAPVSPHLHFPTVPGRLLITPEPYATLVGLTEPGVEVQLLANGQRVRLTQSQATLESDAFPLDFAVMPTLSPNGRYVAYSITSASSGGSEDDEGESSEGESSESESSESESSESEEETSGYALYLYDRETDETVEIAASARTNFVHWTPDHTALIFNDIDRTNGVSVIRQYHLADATLRDLTDPAKADIDGAALASDGQQWAFSGTIQGQHGLWLRSGDAGAYTPLVATSSPGELVGTSLRWSPDGTYIAYIRQQTYELVETATGAVHVIDNSASAAPASWSPDASALVFGTTGTPPQIRRYDIDTQTSVAIASGQTPQWSPDGHFVLFADPTGTTVIRHELTTGAEEDVAQPADLIPSTLQAVASGHVGFLTGANRASQTYYRLTPAGRFVFDEFPLDAGDHVFTAIAVDPEGNTSSASEGILIAHLVDHQADLALTATDIQIFPAVPRLDDITRVSVTVRNQGVLTSADTTLSLVAIDPAGNATMLLTDHPIAPLVTGGQALFSAPWTVGDDVGRYKLVAVADPDNLVFENSESNNTAIIDLLVSDDALPAIAVDLDAPIYTSQQTVEVTANVTNGGDPWTGRVDITVEDEAGFPVAGLIEEAVTGLAYSGRLILTPTWNTGASLAGAYRVVGRLYDIHDQLVAETSVPFRITASADLTATVVSERLVYTANEQVQAIGVITYASGNHILTGVNATVRLTNAAGDVLAERTLMVDQLLPGTQVTVDLDWQTGLQPTAVYRLQFDVSQHGELLQRARGQFTLAPSGLQLTGQLALSNSAPALGTAQVVSYTVANEGNTAAAQMPIFIRLLEPVSQTVVQEHRVLTDIDVAGRTSHTVSFDTANLSLRRYTTLLQVEADDGNGGETRLTLASGDFVVTDRDAPVVSVITPTDHGFLNGSSTLTIRAWDETSTVARVEFRLDGGAWRSAVLQGGIDRTYGGSLPRLSPGTHTLQARAIDAVGHDGLSPVVTFTVDHTAPQITVSGVASGQVYGTNVTPVITMTDPHLKSSAMSLNSQPFESGQVISDEGAYQLAISATDTAGNREGLILTFVIDKTAPEIAVQGVESNQAYNTSVTPIINVTDATDVIQTVTLNGEPFASGLVISAEGDYSLVVQATDATGQRSSASFTFRIDTTAPVIVVNGVEDQAVYRGDPYLYQVVATDADGDLLTYTLMTAPPGMAIDVHTGLISWVPNAAGTVTVEIRVEDPYGAYATQRYTLTVLEPK